MNRAAIADFLGYVSRRAAAMTIGGAALAVAGVTGLTLAGGGSTAVWLGGAVVLGLVLMWAAQRGQRMVREARSLSQAAQRLQLVTWVSRGPRSLTANQVMVTLDVPGSTQRTPLAELKADWHSPGRLDVPSQPAAVFGTLSRGRTVLAVTDDGSCFLGRVRMVRADGPGSAA